MRLQHPIYFKYHFRGTQRICSSLYLFPIGILLAGKNIRCSNELAGKFLIVRGFGWELLTFLAFQAGLAEKLWRPRTTEKKYPFPPPRVVTNIWRLAREIAFAEKTGFVSVIFARDFKARGCLHMYRSKNFPHLHVRLIPIVILSVCWSSRDVLLHWIETNRVNLTAVICIFIHRFKFRRPVACVQRFTVEANWANKF